MAKFISKIDAHLEDVYSWHQEFGSSERLAPPWSNGELLRQEQKENQSIKFLKTDSGVILEKSLSNHSNKTITLERIKSQRKTLHHVKNFKTEENKTILHETISVNFFKSLIPQSIGQRLYHSRLAKEFHFRGQRIENDIRQHKKFNQHKRQNIAILGSTNNLGRQFKPFFTSGKHNIFMCVKRKPYPTAREIQIGKTYSKTSVEKLKSLDSVIFFALDDYSVLKSKQKVNKAFKEKAIELQNMFKTFKENDCFPKTFVMMSSTCVYSNPSQNATESDIISPHNKASEYFLALESIVQKLEKYGTRVVIARTGTVLSARTGMLKNSIMKQKYTMSYQAMPEKKFINWTTMDDAIYAVNHILFNYQLKGAINVCSSMTLKANDLHLLLSQKLKKPFIFKIPSFIFETFYDNITHEEILQNNAVYPSKLKKSNFDLKFNNINDALDWETGNFHNINNNNYNYEF